MPATISKSRTASRSVRRAPALKRPAKPFTGEVTNEWLDYFVAWMKHRTPADVRRDLIKSGIIDKKGNYTAPYRAD
jgi:hypothetical protein